MIIAIDTETTGLQAWNGHYPFVITASDEEGNRALWRLAPPLDSPLYAADGFLRPVRPKGGRPLVLENWACQSNIEGVSSFDDLFELLREADVILMYNAKFDIQMLESIGVYLPRSKVQDVMILIRLLLPNFMRIGLKDMATSLLKVSYDSDTRIKEWMRANNAKEQYYKIPADMLYEYATDDVVYTMALYKGLRPKLPESMLSLYENEQKLVSIVCDMESRGMLCDIEYARTQAAHCRREQAKALAFVEEVYGAPINLNSPKQLQGLLFDKLELHKTLSIEDRRRYAKILYTPKGLYATKREALKVYDHPVISRIMEYRMYGKMAGTYFEKFVELADDEPAIHTSFWQCGPRTGRFSGSDPSFQTIPSVTSGRLLDFDRSHIPDVRHCFGPREGFVLYAPDFSQIELRIASWYAQEEVMMRAFIEGRDIHDETTKAIFPDDWEDPNTPGKIEKSRRTFCKMVNFGVLYGMGLGKLSSDLGVPVERARAFLDRYFATYPGLKELMERCQRNIVTRGYVESCFGRRAKCEPKEAYKSLNYLIQGTAADIMKQTMLRMDALFRQLCIEAYLLNTVHDEVIFELAIEHDTLEFHRELKHSMEYWPIFAPVPITVNCKRAIDRWGNHKEVW